MKYIVKRHGSNAANQSMQPIKVLGTIEAESYDYALQKAYERWTCYNNQHFELIDLAGRTRKEDRDEASRMDALGGA